MKPKYQTRKPMVRDDGEFRRREGLPAILARLPQVPGGD
jgi:hypothetical protein